MGCMSCILVPRRRRVCSDIVFVYTTAIAICITLLRTECYYVSENEDAYSTALSARVCVIIRCVWWSMEARPACAARLSHCCKRLARLCLSVSDRCCEVPYRYIGRPRAVLLQSVTTASSNWCTQWIRTFICAAVHCTLFVRKQPCFLEQSI